MIRKMVLALTMILVTGFLSSSFAMDANVEYKKTKALLGNDMAAVEENFAPADVSRNSFLESDMSIYASSNCYFCKIKVEEYDALKELCNANGVTMKSCMSGLNTLDGAIMYVKNPQNNMNFIETIVHKYNAAPFDGNNVKVSIFFAGTILGVKVHQKLFTINQQLSFNQADEMICEIVGTPYGEKCTLIKGIKKFAPTFFQDFPNKSFGLTRIGVFASASNKIDGSNISLVNCGFIYRGVKID